MEGLKKSFNKVWYGWLFGSIILLLIGILLLVKPAEVISIIVNIIGISVIVLGVFGIIRYFRTKDESFNFDLVYGVICIIAGALIISNIKVVASFLPILIGIWIIANSIIKIQYAMNLKDYANSNWLTVMIISVLSLAVGILFVFNPFKGAKLLTQGLGIALCAYSIVDIANAIILRKNIKNFTNKLKKFGEDIKEAVYEEIKEVKEAVDKSMTEEKPEEEKQIEEKPAKKTTTTKKTTSSKKNTTTKKKSSSTKSTKKTNKK